MRVAKDTTLRFLATLQLLPVYPEKKSTRQIRDGLKTKQLEYQVDIRTIQRDLEKLSSVFPINCDPLGRSNYWYWMDRNALTQIPSMGPSTALAFKLAADYLKPIMPPSTLRLLEPYFRHANEILRETKLGRWAAKTRIINRGPQLIPPIIRKGVQDVVYQALLEDKQFVVDYQGRGQAQAKRYTLNPLGIVFRYGIIYLVATLWDYEEPMHFALHRMSKAALLNNAARRLPGFNLSQHIEEDMEFSYPVTNKKIKLRAIFSIGAAFHLQESMLSTDQKLVKQKDGRVLVTATVDDTDELRWWLLGFGGQAEVLAPKLLRHEIKNEISRMNGNYY